MDESSALVDIPNYVVVGEEVGQSYQVVNNEKGESSQAVDNDRGKGVLVCSDNEQEDAGGLSSSEDEDNNDRLDDSEEERALGFEDGFEEAENDSLNEDSGAKKSDKRKNVQVNNIGDVDDIDWGKEYESEELDSDDLDLSGDEKAPVYDVFKPN